MKRPSRNSDLVACFLIIGIISSIVACIILIVSSKPTCDSDHPKEEIITGDSTVEIGLDTSKVSETNIDRICAYCYETTLYSGNGNIVRRYISTTRPGVVTFGGDWVLIIEEFGSAFYIQTTCHNSTNYTISKKLVPISWIPNILGEYVYEGRKQKHYNHYLTGKRSIAGEWKEEWWSLFK